jgi:hypothetical protein
VQPLYDLQLHFGLHHLVTLISTFQQSLPIVDQTELREPRNSASAILISSLIFSKLRIQARGAPNVRGGSPGAKRPSNAKQTRSVTRRGAPQLRNFGRGAAPVGSLLTRHDLRFLILEFWFSNNHLTSLPSRCPVT